MGGIYALERIAKESEEDHWSIMEVLTAYVRQHAPWIPNEEPDEKPAHEPDIQAIMTVIGRRTRSFNHGEPERLDLHQTNLSGATLTEANLSGAELWGADLLKAKLWEADLTGAILTGAILWTAILSGANLSGANLTQEELERTNGDENTQLPPDLKPPAHWNVKTDEQIEGDRTALPKYYGPSQG